MRQLSRFPLFGNFVLFRSEVFRTRYNTLMLGVEEFNSKNKKLKKVGAERLLSMLATMSVTPALSALGFWLLGIDGEEEEAIRVSLPDYAKNNQYIPLGFEDGKFEFIDLSFIDPSSDFHRAVQAALRGEKITDKAGGFMAELGGGFMDTDILLKALLEAGVKNSDQYGRKVYNEELPLLPKAYDIMKHIGEPLVPGVAKNIVTIGKGAFGVEDDIYQIDVPNELVNNVMGMKVKTRKLDSAIGFALGDMVKRYEDARSIFHDKKTKKSYEVAKKRMDEIFEEMKVLHDAGLLLFPDKLYEQMDKRRVYKYIQDDLDYGEIEDYKFRDDLLEKIEE